MIRYALSCKSGHSFEGWFGSSADYERQRRRNLVECPSCGSREVSKELMAPAVSTARKREERQAQKEPVPATVAAALPAPFEAEKREMLRQLRDLRDKVLADSENVGPRFSEEARKIHYGEAEQRGIHGQASLEEAAELLEEGISVLPIPDLPGDRN
jgi:hypothetical protein